MYRGSKARQFYKKKKAILLKMKEKLKIKANLLMKYNLNKFS